jgi:preprotein translocase subunit SecY
MSQQSQSLFENVLFKRIFYTIVALFIFRLGTFIPTPGIDTKALADFANHQGVGLLKLLNMFTGGALSKFSVFSLGVMPYISASIIMQLMTVIVPTLEQLQKEGGVGRQKIVRITRTLAVLLAFIQGYLFSAGLESAQGSDGSSIVMEPGLQFRLMSALLLASGSALVMWIGEQITDKGIGNGISLVIFAGIVSALPPSVYSIIQQVQQNSALMFDALTLFAFLLVVIVFITFIESSYRKIPIHYARRTIGVKVMSEQSTHLPLKVNMSGIMAAIFASTLLAVPATFLGFNQKLQDHPLLLDLLPGQWLYNVIFAVLAMFFAFFYTSIIFKPDDVAENLKKQNAFIPGLRPGSETANALDSVVTRLTLVGGLYLNLVVILPSAFGNSLSNQMALGGTSMLIMVGVALEVIRQVSAHLATQKYDNLIFSKKE